MAEKNSWGLKVASLPDLVIAHVAFFSATQVDLLGGNSTRVIEGTVHFYREGLMQERYAAFEKGEALKTACYLEKF